MLNFLLDSMQSGDGIPDNIELNNSNEEIAIILLIALIIIGIIVWIISEILSKKQ